MGGQHLASHRHTMGGQGQADTGKQRHLPDGLGAEQQVQRGDDGQQVKRQGQNRDHDHNQVVVEQAFMDKRGSIPCTRYARQLCQGLTAHI
ncbi:hypothetical protein D3C75_934750 [compost metagenome]